MDFYAQLASFVASGASVILAILAIWLSVVFFRMSNQASQNTNDAAKGIASSVERLEKLFDTLYSDTFSMMRDTVSDMRKHVWPSTEDGSARMIASDEVEHRADQKIAALKETLDAQINEVLQRQQTDTNSLRNDMEALMDRAINSSRKAEIEARDETLREHILSVLRTATDEGRALKGFEVLDQLPMFDRSRVIEELKKMRGERVIDSPAHEGLGPNTPIHLISPHTTPQERSN